MSKIPEAEKTSVTPATVVAGLGYPNGREEISPEPTGEAGARSTRVDSRGDVSRETV